MRSFFHFKQLKAVFTVESDYCSPNDSEPYEVTNFQFTSCSDLNFSHFLCIEDAHFKSSVLKSFNPVRSD
jgi:hypothetical protein